MSIFAAAAAFTFRGGTGCFGAAEPFFCFLRISGFFVGVCSTDCMSLAIPSQTSTGTIEMLYFSEVVF